MLECLAKAHHPSPEAVAKAAEQAPAKQGQKIAFQSAIAPLRPAASTANRMNGQEPSEAAARALLEAVKVHLSSAASGKTSKYCTARIKNMYPGSLIPQGGERCARYKLAEISPSIANHYRLHGSAHKGRACARLSSGWCGLEAAKQRAHKKLAEFLRAGGLKPARAKGFYMRESRSTSLAIVRGGTGIKCSSKADAEHLTSILKAYYRLSIDYAGSHYARMKLGWGCDARAVECSMPGCAQKALQELKHTRSIRVLRLCKGVLIC